MDCIACMKEATVLKSIKSITAAFCVMHYPGAAVKK